MKKHIILLPILFFIIFILNFINSFVENYTHPYLINRGINLYTQGKINKLTMDEYWLLNKIDQVTGGVKSEYLLSLKEKHKDNPYKKLINRNDYMRDIKFERHKNKNENKTGPDYYTIKNLPVTITNWDRVLLKALYCDRRGFDNEDFRILSLLKNNKGDYHDTHYLLGLIFLKENNCYKNEIVEKEIKKTTEIIAKIQDKDKELSDLYAERIVVLYWAGYGKNVKKEWIDLVAKSFDKEYGWYDKDSPGFNAHATSLSLLSLIYYKEGKDKQSIF